MSTNKWKGDNNEWQKNRQQQQQQTDSWVVIVCLIESVKISEVSGGE